MGCLLGGPREKDLPLDQLAGHAKELAVGWVTWRSVVDWLHSEVRVATEARATLERRYYGGHDVLFADAANRWAEHVEQVERLIGIANALSPTTGKRRHPPARNKTGSVEARVADRVARLADDARVRAYEVLGERLKAVDIMERRLL